MKYVVKENGNSDHQTCFLCNDSCRYLGASGSIICRPGHCFQLPTPLLQEWPGDLQLFLKAISITALSNPILSQTTRKDGVWLEGIQESH
jgi:hypothetical protein